MITQAERFYSPQGLTDFTDSEKESIANDLFRLPGQSSKLSVNQKKIRWMSYLVPLILLTEKIIRQCIN
jgi:hypothetical protein